MSLTLPIVKAVSVVCCVLDRLKGKLLIVWDILSLLGGRGLANSLRNISSFVTDEKKEREREKDEKWEKKSDRERTGWKRTRKKVREKVSESEEETGLRR